MFTFEWIGPAGVPLRYVDQEGVYEVVDGVQSASPRQPTESELVFINEARPEPVYDQLAKLKIDLTDALNTLRTATSDNLITKEEVAAAIAVVLPALESYRDYGRFNDEVSVLQDLVGDQIMLALLIISQQVEYGLKAIATQLYGVRADLDDLTYRFNQTQAPQE